MRSWLTKVLVALTAPQLEAELAGGSAPESSLRHALRARQLTAPRQRFQLAQDWERLLLLAQSDPEQTLHRVPIRRERIQRAAPEIQRLVSALRASGPIPAQGVATARWLLCDGTGPLFTPRAPDVLEDLLARAVELLDPALPLSSNLPDAGRGDGRSDLSSSQRGVCGQHLVKPCACLDQQPGR